MELASDQSLKPTTSEDFKRKIASLALDTRLMAISTANGRKTLYQEPHHLVRLLKNKTQQLSQELSEARSLINSTPGLVTLERNVYNIKNKFAAVPQKRDRKMMELKQHSLGDFVRHFSDDSKGVAKAAEMFDIYQSKKESTMFLTGVQTTMLQASTTHSNLIESRVRAWDQKKRLIVRQTEETSALPVSFSDTQLNYKKIVATTAKVNLEKRVNYLNTIKTYSKTRNLRARDSVLDSIKHNDSFRSTLLNDSRVATTAYSSPTLKLFSDLASQLKSHMESTEARDFITLLMAQIEGLDILDLRDNGGTFSKRPEISEKIAWNTVKLLQSTEYSKVRVQSNPRSRLITLNILTSSHEAELADIVYFFVETVIIPQMAQRGLTIERDEDGKPIWAVLFYLIRFGKDDVAKSIIMNYHSQLRADVEEFCDLYTKRGSTENEKSRIYSNQIDSKEDIDFFKTILFSLVCKESKDIKPGFFFEESHHYMWFWLKMYLLNDTQDRAPSSSNLMNNLETLQAKVRDLSSDWLTRHRGSLSGLCELHGPTCHVGSGWPPSLGRENSFR